MTALHQPIAADPLLDPEAIREAKTVMREKFPAMVGYFIEDTAGYIASIEKALAEGNPEAMVPPAHTAKSSCRQMGASRLSALAKSIEFIARSAVSSGGTLDAVPALLEEMRHTYADTCEAYKSVL